MVLGGGGVGGGEGRRGGGVGGGGGGIMGVFHTSYPPSSRGYIYEVFVKPT